MKKIIITMLLAMLIIPYASNAQVVIKTQSTIETIASCRMGWISIMKVGESYSLAIRSDNEYDKSYIIDLGEGKDKAIQSIDTFIRVAEIITNEDTMEFENGKESIRIYRGLFNGEIWFKANGYAGYGKTSKSELSKLLKKLKKNRRNISASPI